LELDRLTTDGNQNLGFEPAAILLVGPDAGVGPEITSALYRALAMMSDIRSLGTVKTHTGLNGESFSAETSSGQGTIVVDPASGTLLEARDLHDQTLFSAIADSYVTTNHWDQCRQRIVERHYSVARSARHVNRRKQSDLTCEHRCGHLRYRTDKRDL
jgi:hypothetical protein